MYVPRMNTCMYARRPCVRIILSLYAYVRRIMNAYAWDDELRKLGLLMGFFFPAAFLKENRVERSATFPTRSMELSMCKPRGHIGLFRIENKKRELRHAPARLSLSLSLSWVISLYHCEFVSVLIGSVCVRYVPQLGGLAISLGFLFRGIQINGLLCG
jgi:hypothetical protein